MFGHEYPTGKGSEKSKSVEFVQSDMTKMDTYNDYCSNSGALWDAAMELIVMLDKLLSYSTFLRNWDKSHSTLSCRKLGSDFCDLCTTLRDHLDGLLVEDLCQSCLYARLEQQRSDAVKDHKAYRKHITESVKESDGSMQHLVFDFAENVLLPGLVRQPGQFYLINVSSMTFLVYKIPKMGGKLSTAL